MFFDWQVFLVERYIGLHISLGNMDLKDWAAVFSIGWVLYQLIQRRRINETKHRQVPRAAFHRQAQECR